MTGIARQIKWRRPTSYYQTTACLSAAMLTPCALTFVSTMPRHLGLQDCAAVPPRRPWKSRFASLPRTIAEPLWRRCLFSTHGETLRPLGCGVSHFSEENTMSQIPCIAIVIEGGVVRTTLVENWSWPLPFIVVVDYDTDGVEEACLTTFSIGDDVVKAACHLEVPDVYETFNKPALSPCAVLSALLDTKLQRLTRPQRPSFQSQPASRMARVLPQRMSLSRRAGLRLYSKESIMANNYYDATGVLILDKVTPVITALFECPLIGRNLSRKRRGLYR